MASLGSTGTSRPVEGGEPPLGEGTEAAAEEVMAAFDAKDPTRFIDALRELLDLMR